MKLNQIAAVVLAAGKGTRINARHINKVMYPLAGKPMIGYTIELLNKVGFQKIIVVVGFKKESIINYLKNKVVYAEQEVRLGTAHALKCALLKIPSGIENIFVCYSDDTSFYPSLIIEEFVNLHLEKKNDLTLLTLVKKDPTGLGRILRDKNGNITNIIEEKSCNDQQKKIKEINTGCYCFKTDFIKEFLPLIKKDPLKKEYYLTDIVELAIKSQKKVEALKISRGDYFQGVNTKEQLEQVDAKMRFKQGSNS